MSNRIATTARRGIIRIGKYAPFFIVAIATLSNMETLYSVITERYCTFDGMVVYYKPLSWWIGERFELSIAWVVALFVLSFGVEACVWNRACIVFLSLVLLQKDFFLEHTIDETYFAVVLLANSAIGVLLVFKGLKILLLKCPHCGSKLEVEKGDIWFHKDIDGGSSPCVTCAVCKKGFDVEGYKGVQKLLL